MPPADDSLIDLIYEAAILPELWPKVMDTLAALANCAGGVFFALEGPDHAWTASESLVPLMADFVGLGWINRNSRGARAMALNHAGFVTDHDLFTDAEMNMDPLYAEFFRRRGFGWCAGTTIRSPTRDTMIFALERRLEMGPVERVLVNTLDLYRPHLARSSLISARLKLEQASNAATTLAALRLPCAVISDNGSIMAMTPAFDLLATSLMNANARTLVLVDRAADAHLQSALQMMRGGGYPLLSSIVLNHASAEDKMILHIIPVRRSARDVFANTNCLLLVTPISAPALPSVEMINGLFDLTPVEAGLAKSLSAGETLESYAAARQVSKETARKQLKSIMAKTGVSRQADLVRLLSSAVPHIPLY